jgi:dihydrofolate reductase
MSLVQIMICVSLDGYLADRDGGVGWLAPFETPEVEEETNLSAFLAAADVVVMGRRTFDQVIGFGDPWPYGSKRVVVVTHRPLPDDLPRGVVASNDLAATLDQAAARGLRVWICGGASVIGQALALGRVDEVELFVAPVLLGGGIAWFSPAENQAIGLDLLACEGFRSGLVRLLYQPQLG